MSDSKGVSDTESATNHAAEGDGGDGGSDTATERPSRAGGHGVYRGRRRKDGSRKPRPKFVREKLPPKGGAWGPRWGADEERELVKERNTVERNRLTFPEEEYQAAMEEARQLTARVRARGGGGGGAAGGAGDAAVTSGSGPGDELWACEGCDMLFPFEDARDLHAFKEKHWPCRMPGPDGKGGSGCDQWFNYGHLRGLHEHRMHAQGGLVTKHKVTGCMVCPLCEEVVAPHRDAFDAFPFPHLMRRHLYCVDERCRELRPTLPEHGIGGDASSAVEWQGRVFADSSDLERHCSEAGHTLMRDQMTVLYPAHSSRYTMPDSAEVTAAPAPATHAAEREESGAVGELESRLLHAHDAKVCVLATRDSSEAVDGAAAESDAPDEAAERLLEALVADMPGGMADHVRALIKDDPDAAHRWLKQFAELAGKPGKVEEAAEGVGLKSRVGSRAAEAIGLARDTGRISHVPYLLALCSVIYRAHNGNKNGSFGCYPGRSMQRIPPEDVGAALHRRAQRAPAAEATARAPPRAAASVAASRSVASGAEGSGSGAFEYQAADLLAIATADPAAGLGEAAGSDRDSDSGDESEGRGGGSTGSSRSQGSKRRRIKWAGNGYRRRKAADRLPLTEEVAARETVDYTEKLREVFKSGRLGKFTFRASTNVFRQILAGSRQGEWVERRHPRPPHGRRYWELPGEKATALAQRARGIVAREDEVFAHHASEERAPIEDDRTELDAGINSLYGPLEDYMGHNIAAMAVDATTGVVLGVQWNQCLSQQSTAAHAEERLVDRLFATADLLGLPPTKYNELLSRVVVYTSLQPCYQCTGKLIMAGVRHCVWIQDDPKIKVDLFKEVAARDSDWSTTGCSARKLFPETFGPLCDSLASEYAAFVAQLRACKKKEPGSTPFYARFPQASADLTRGVSGGAGGGDLPDDDVDPEAWRSVAAKTSLSDSVPTFLCTDAAKDIYRRASEMFEHVVDVKAGDASPVIRAVPRERQPAEGASGFTPLSVTGTSITSVTTQAEAYLYLRSVVKYVTGKSYLRGRFT